MCLYLSDENTLSLVLTILDIFTKCSGLKVNRDKSEAMFIGVSSNIHHNTKYIKWANECIKCLGVLIDKNPDKTIQENIKHKLF